MTKLEIENKILDIVTASQGLKGVDLTLRVMSNDLQVTSNELFDIIFDLIEKGDLVEIEYELPSMGYRTKSFILPRGTKVNVVNKVRIK